MREKKPTPSERNSLTGQAGSGRDFLSLGVDFLAQSVLARLFLLLLPLPGRLLWHRLSAFRQGNGSKNSRARTLCARKSRRQAKGNLFRFCLPVREFLSLGVGFFSRKAFLLGYFCCCFPCPAALLWLLFRLSAGQGSSSKNSRARTLCARKKPTPSEGIL